MELDLKVLFSILGTAIPLTFGAVVAFHNMKSLYKDELRKTEKEFSEKIDKQNEKISQLKEKLSEQNVDFEKLKNRDENQQQIIDQINKMVYDLIPSLSQNINSQK
ncbi:hypothetical protein [Flavobacterium sp. NRK F7]|uniref:hypothetical protein n=1 Tax=Flavobacterium sp. NRK F7 TaxID=2954930 RepID=UPI0020915732|nr:hypothetical protein [Flavobacterium sp. NRK F7]MCO6163695.1 hypothetical protein [Flavobacterium sp. NRK F7]